MTLLNRLASIVRWLIGRHRVEQNMDDELQTFLDMAAADRMRDGVHPADARRQAALRLGGLDQAKECIRTARHGAWVDDLLRDMGYASRTCSRNPGFSAVVIITLAFGIGANAAIFSIVNTLLFRPLPVLDPQHLAIVSDTRAVSRGFAAGWTYQVWDQIRQRAELFDGVCAWWTERLNLASQGGEAEPVDAMWVSGNYFAALGVPAIFGRTIDRADDVRGRAESPVAVISYELWQRRFGGSADTVGAPLVIDRVPFTVVGITPPDFFGAEVGRTFDVALPIETEPLIRGADSRFQPARGSYVLSVLLRLKSSQSIDAATAALRGIQPQIREAAMPATWPPIMQREFLKDPFVTIPAAMGTSRLRARYERPMTVILVVVALVLVMACVNIANLQLARGMARRHELSVRVALGASRWRLVRQSLAESLFLAVAGTILGLFFASWSSPLIVDQLSTALSRVHLNLSLDGRVLAFTAVITIASTVIFGLFPALRTSGVTPGEALREHGRGPDVPERARLSNGLVVAQVALSVVIVIGAVLFARSFGKLATLPLGFDRDGVLLVNVNTARTRVAARDRMSFVQRLARDIAALPGVTNAAASFNTPVTGVGMIDLIRLPGIAPSFQPMAGGKLGPLSTYANVVTPGWFATYGTTIRAGRDFDDRDVGGAPLVVIVNEAFIRKFLADRDPIGATVVFERGPTPPESKTVIGVVNNAVYNSVRDEGVPTAYVPLLQAIPGAVPTEMTISVRSSSGSPPTTARSIAATLSAADPDIVFGFRLMSDQIGASLTQERIVALLSGFFGGGALVIAAVGLYGMTAHAVSRRRNEIGIRMALGAAPAKVVQLILWRAGTLVGGGLLIGCVVSWWTSHYVASMLFGIEPHDPATLILAVLVLASIGGVAAWLPVYRATRADPMVALRCE